MKSKYRGQVANLKDVKPIWAYGSVCEVESKTYIILTDATIEYGVYGLDKVINGIIEVVPETVGQCIDGLTDNKHAEVYFGDKIRSDTGHIGIVKWNKEKCCVYFDWGDKKNSYPLCYYDYNDFEVIGTIHDEPEGKV